MATIILPLYGLMKKRMNRPLSISSIAKAQRLTFSKILKVGTYIIAIDAMRKKLLYFKNKEHTKTCVVIDLSHVAACSTRKEYNPIAAGALNKRKLSDFLKSIHMILCFKKHQGSVSIPLYETGAEQFKELEELEEHVKSCEITISKLLPPQIEERA
jgi:hypothetical protein